MKGCKAIINIYLNSMNAQYFVNLGYESKIQNKGQIHASL